MRQLPRVLQSKYGITAEKYSNHGKISESTRPIAWFCLRPMSQQSSVHHLTRFNEEISYHEASWTIPETAALLLQRRVPGRRGALRCRSLTLFVHGSP